MRSLSSRYVMTLTLAVFNMVLLVGCNTTPNYSFDADYELPIQVPDYSSGSITTSPDSESEQFSDSSVKAELQESLKPARYSLHLIETPVSDVLQQLAWMADKELELWPNQAPTITIRADDVTLNELLHRVGVASGLQVLLQQRRIVARPDQLYWQAYPVDLLNLERSKLDDLVTNLNIGQISTIAATQNSSQSRMQVVSESNIWGSLTANIAQILVSEPLSTELLPAQRVMTQPEAGLVMVLASYHQQQQVAHWLSELQTRTRRQVLIEAVIAEVTLSEAYQTGIDWNLDGFINRSGLTQMGHDRTFSARLGSVGLDVMLGLRWLENFGQVSVLSSPRVKALNNQPAMLKVVDNFVYFTIGVVRITNQNVTEVTYGSNLNSVPVGLILNVQPMITEQQEVLLNVRPSVTRIIGQVLDPNPDLAAVGVQNFVPLIQEREMETLLRLENQETVIIGGLIQQRQDENQAGLYGLARHQSPLARLFGFRQATQSKTEMVVLLRATVIGED
ncbi:type II secretion system protein GspD [Thiomicrospira cyclica]|uniref:Type II and III secretion system protein n=1 Tax=Thiomicrospira cyclica (strain DSM 14477 / JCM 11371 / ALM1) TaxID=717773 RepID=F6D8T6_THICA|nr:type II and III secretion system protein [Thiomicrospira cyclica]AEG31936.1 type II and III secretion system protein [Thiomicrospira cyclica ALM1]